MQLPIIERIMRETIFHSTLDWQTKEQFDAGALDAYKEYKAAKDFYDAENKFHIYRFHLSKTDEKLAAAVDKLGRAAAKGVSGRITKCQAEMEKLRDTRARLAEKTEFWEKIMTRMSRLLA
jgi:hypothetical protein